MINSGIQKQKVIYHKTIKIFGPPGTGKTHTLIERVLKGYLKRGVHPSDIAFISFTNKAVNTARDRALATFPEFTTDDFARFKLYISIVVDTLPKKYLILRTVCWIMLWKLR